MKEKERHGTRALMEQECFIQHCVGIYTVLQDSYFQQRYYHVVHKKEECTYHHVEGNAWIPQFQESLASPLNSGIFRN